MPAPIMLFPLLFIDPISLQSDNRDNTYQKAKFNA